MSVVSNNILAGASGQGGAGYEIERSLRFNSADSAYLNRTPSAAGNQKTWTWSGWVKLTDITNQTFIFAAGSSPYVQIYTDSSKLYIQTNQGYLLTTQVFRDPSAWQHWVFAFDTTQATAANRVKFYINGTEVTTWDVDQRSSITQNVDTGVNAAVSHAIGKQVTGSGFSNTYLADVHFIDGQALAPTNFGETDDNGVWQPKEFDGTYGPLVDQSQTWSSLGTGTPDSASTNWNNSFDGTISTSASGLTYGASGATMTWTVSPITVTSSVVIYAYLATGNESSLRLNGSVNPTNATNAYGAPITFTAAQLGGSLSKIELIPPSSGAGCATSAIEVDGKLLVDSGVTVTDNSFHLPFSDNSSNAALGTDTSGNSNTWTVNNMAAASATIPAFTAYSASNWGDEAYLWDGSLSTYAYPSANTTSTLTFTPALTGSSIRIYVGSSLATTGFNINGSSLSGFSGGTASAWRDITSHTGGTLSYIQCAYVPGQYSQYIYAIEIDGDILRSTTQTVETDCLVDSPTNGNQTDTGAGGEITGCYCTMNPIHPQSTLTLSNGNLDVTGNSGAAFSTFLLTSGKWYVESTAVSPYYNLVFSQPDHPPGVTSESNSKSIGWYQNGTLYYGAGTTSGAGSYTAGDVLGAAIDMDNSTIKLYKNGTLTITVDFSTGSYHRFAEGMYINTWGGSGSHSRFNFGQRAFAYTAPSGYKSLNTANLPEPTIADGSQYFDTKLYTGNSGTQQITGYNFSPDFLWIKSRTNPVSGYFHHLHDSVRGLSSGFYKNLYSNTAEAENVYPGSTHGGVNSLNSDGFSLANAGSSYHLNNNTTPYVAWAWDAGSSNTTIPAGSLNSSVYDQSEVWSTTGTVTGGTSGSIANAFNGNTSAANGWSAYAGGTGTSTYTFASAVTGTKFEIELYCSLAFTGFLVNGVDFSNSNQSLSGNFKIDVTSACSSGLSSILQSWEFNVHATYVVGIYVDGKLLVDSGITLANVPSIASTVRANPSAGFSIASYTISTGVNSTIGHGLNTAPAVSICKLRNGSGDWYARFKGGSFDGYLLLNSTSAGSSQANTFTSTTLIPAYLGGSNEEWISYNFAPVEGYSAMGSYVGNGSADGPFVFTGFRPRWILGKATTTTFATGDWFIYDTERETFNSQSKPIGANTSNVEDSGGYYYIDVLSNGFKIRGQYDMTNKSAETYIWVALAENPFKTARAR
jgi:hypothetical protein